MVLRLDSIKLNEIGMEIICSHMKDCTFFQTGRVVGRGGIVSRQLSREEWMQAHQYVLKNCDEVH